MREVAPIERRRQGAQAVTLSRLQDLLKLVRVDKRLIELDQADLIEFLAGTGCRIGEACGLAWDDVDLISGIAHIHANVIRGKGIGVIRQDHPKTKAGVRSIALPDSLVQLLNRREAEKLNRAGSLIFPTILGNIRDPRNTARDWAASRDRLGFPDVTTHSFRKTVATLLDQAGLTAREIAEYLGHENPSLTQDVYMAKNTGGKRAAAAINEVLAIKIPTWDN